MRVISQAETFRNGKTHKKVTTVFEDSWEERVENTVDHFSVIFPPSAPVSATWYPF